MLDSDNFGKKGDQTCVQEEESALDVLREIGDVVSTMEEGLKLEHCN